jgi:hypothetical protein
MQKMDSKKLQFQAVLLFQKDIFHKWFCRQSSQNSGKQERNSNDDVGIESRPRTVS